MTTSMTMHTTTRHMRHIVANMTTTIATMGMTTHRIVMNRMSNTATMGIITMLILTTHTLMMPTAIIMARVSPSRRSRPRRLGSWWRR